MALMKLKAGDKVKLKKQQIELTVISEDRKAGTVQVKHPRGGEYEIERSRVVKTYIRSEASKLAAKANFWNGRLLSIRHQLFQLGKDLPVADDKIQQDIYSLASLLNGCRLLAEVKIEQKLAELKRK